MQESRDMSYASADARQQLLDELASAAEQLAIVLARLGEAYERMDEDAADRLEQELFRPAQAAYGVAQRTHAAFSNRHSIPARSFEQGSPGLPASPREEIERSVEALETADGTLAALQDSMLPVEVGDRELRTGLARVRELIAPVPGAAHKLLRTLGR
jgi:hypothetical protein